MKLPWIRLLATGSLVAAGGNATVPASPASSVSSPVSSVSSPVSSVSSIVVTVVSVETLLVAGASPSTRCYGLVSRLCDYNFPTRKLYTTTSEEPSSYTLLDSDTRALYTYTPSAWTTTAVGPPLDTGLGTKISSASGSVSSLVVSNTSAVTTYGNNATTTRRMDFVGDFIAAALTFWFLMN